jgi:hypothetical protein
MCISIKEIVPFKEDIKKLFNSHRQLLVMTLGRKFIAQLLVLPRQLDITMQAPFNSYLI